VTELAFYLVSALVTAAVWSLPAAGVSLIYAVMRYPNFAVAEFMTAGTFMCLAVSSATALPFWASAAVAVLLAGVLAAAVDQAVFRQVRAAGVLPPILLSLGLMLLLQNTVRFLWGNEVRQFDTPLQRPWNVAGLTATPSQVAIILIAPSVLLALWGLLRWSRLGRDIRAVANNPELALASGVEPERVYMLVLFLAGALAALGGILLGLEASITPLLGWHTLIPIFAVAILGGLGNLFGTYLSALLLALVSEYSLLFLPASYKAGLAFLVLAIVLLVRPQGLLRGER